MDKGIIYVLTNKYMPNLVKIGMTTQSIDKRIKDLSNATGVPYPFDCSMAYYVPLDKLKVIENALHAAFDCVRVSPNREFFKIPNPDTLRSLLVVLGGCNVKDDATDDIQSALDNSLDKAEQVIVHKKRPNFDFISLGLKVGDTIYYAQDDAITCTIVDSKHVDYKDDHCVSLSAVTRDIRGYIVAPLPFWKAADGELLSDKYNSIHNAYASACACEENAKALHADYQQFNNEIQ